MHVRNPAPQHWKFDALFQVPGDQKTARRQFGRTLSAEDSSFASVRLAN